MVRNAGQQAAPAARVAGGIKTKETSAGVDRQGLTEHPTYPYCPTLFANAVEVAEPATAALRRFRSRNEATDYVPLSDGYSPVEYLVCCVFRAPTLP